MQSREDILNKFRALVEDVELGDSYNGPPLPGEDLKRAEIRALAWVLNKEIPRCARVR